MAINPTLQQQQKDKDVVYWPAHYEHPWRSKIVEGELKMEMTTDNA